MNEASLYERVLGLRHLRLPIWWRATLSGGSFVLGILLALAELASAWVIVVLPVTVAAVVKLHDVVAGTLAHPSAPARRSHRR